MDDRHQEAKAELAQRLAHGFEWPPLRFRPVDSCSPATDVGMEAGMEAAWNGHSERFRFAVQAQLQDTPRQLEAAMDRVLRQRRRGWSPLVLVPYLSEEKLQRLQAREVSGIDLCGNGFVIVPGKLLVMRTGRANRFPNTAAIKKIYNGKSSLIPRLLAIEPLQPSIGAIRDRVQALNDGHEPIALSTVSKVVAELVEQLILARRDDGGVRLRDPEKLLRELARHYDSPTISQRVTGKLSPAPDLASIQRYADDGAVLTGMSSFPLYTSQPLSLPVKLYCRDAAKLTAEMGNHFDTSSRFPNLTLLETDDWGAYFDCQRNPADWYAHPPASENGSFASKYFRAASPLQTWLELTRQETDRDREAAADMHRELLRRLHRQLESTHR